MEAGPLRGRQLPVGEGRSGPGPVAEGLEVDASAMSEAGMSEAGSSRAGDEPQTAKWGGVLNNFWKRCSTQEVSLVNNAWLDLHNYTMSEHRGFPVSG